MSSLPWKDLILLSNLAESVPMDRLSVSMVSRPEWFCFNATVKSKQIKSALLQGPEYAHGQVHFKALSMLMVKCSAQIWWLEDAELCCLDLQWANLMMQQMWEYYDRAIGQAIKESVEPIMQQYKPPGLVKSIFFKRITFGDAPITIDEVMVENEGEKHIVIEVSLSRLQHCVSCTESMYAPIMCALHSKYKETQLVRQLRFGTLLVF